MDKYLIILTAPSMHFMNEDDNYIEPYILSFKKGTSLSRVGEYVDEVLTRKFCWQYSVALADVRILAAAKLR
jgi:hypothetical protein